MAHPSPKNLTVTIYTGTLNPQLPMLKQMLDSVRMQDYGGVLEHIVMDGGSTNGTIELAKKYGCIVISDSKLAIKEQKRFCLGMLRAKGDLILMLESDNILTSKNWIKKMVEPFKFGEVFCAFSAYNHFSSEMNGLTKYSALFGSPDPVLYYLRKSDKIPLTMKRYDKGRVLQETKNHYIVQFTNENLPVMGDNGHIVRREVLAKVIRDPDDFIHVDAYSELMSRGYDTFGVVKNSIIHLTQASLFSMVRRRVEVKNKFYDKKRKKRKYYVYNPKSTMDNLNLTKFVLFSITLLIPLIESIIGYLKIKERAWFLHPIVCLAMVIAYGTSEIHFYSKKLRKMKI